MGENRCGLSVYPAPRPIHKEQQPPVGGGRGAGSCQVTKGQTRMVTSLCPTTEYLLDAQKPDIFPYDLFW